MYGASARKLSVLYYLMFDDRSNDRSRWPNKNHPWLKTQGWFYMFFYDTVMSLDHLFWEPIDWKEPHI